MTAFFLRKRNDSFWHVNLLLFICIKYFFWDGICIKYVPKNDIKNNMWLFIEGKK